ncbi:porin, partial [Pseudomonas aeruginosa]
MRGVSTNGGNDAGSNGKHGLSAQAEYLRRTVKADRDREDLKASGYYSQLAYTLTGEPRLYKLDGAKFDTIKPDNKE